MTTSLILLSVFFSAIILYLLHRSWVDKLKYRSKINRLQDIMLTLIEKQEQQNQQLVLIENFQENWKMLRELLSKEIYELGYSFFEERSSGH